LNVLLEVGSVVLASTMTDAFEFSGFEAVAVAFSHNLSPELVFYFLDLEHFSPVYFTHIIPLSIPLSIPCY